MVSSSLKAVGAALLTSLSLAATAQSSQPAPSSPASPSSYYPVKELLSTTKTVVGEDIRYPTTGAPRVTVSIVTVAPGSDAAFHRQGDALVEAMDVPHRGYNPGTALVRLLAVYIGAEGTANVALD
jgi:hypothetical protein